LTSESAYFFLNYSALNTIKNITMFKHHVYNSKSYGTLHTTSKKSATIYPLEEIPEVYTSGSFNRQVAK
jgi:hypothetical protein